MNLAINREQQSIKAILIALAIATVICLLTTASTVSSGYINYNIPVSSVDTGYYPNYKKNNNW